MSVALTHKPSPPTGIVVKDDIGDKLTFAVSPYGNRASRTLQARLDIDEGRGDQYVRISLDDARSLGQSLIAWADGTDNYDRA